MFSIVAFALISQTAAPSCCGGSMAQFLSDPAFISAHERPLPFKFQSKDGKDVSFAGPDGSHSGYYVAGKPGSPGIVMVHEWWGLNDYIKREAVRLHESTGYGVLAVDLYKGQIASSPEDAGKLMAAVMPDEADTTLKDAVECLYDGSFGVNYHRIGSIGWCFGGGYSLQTAIQGSEKVKACVMYYGMPDDSPNDLARLKAPVLLVEALQDKWITPELVKKFKAAAVEAKKRVRVITFDADHAFANPSNPHYNKADAQEAMSKSIEFFHKNLG